MMCQVFFDHLFCQFFGGITKIASGTKVAPSIPLIYVRKLFKYFIARAPFDPSHNLRWRHFRRCGHQNMDMILTYYTTQYLNLELLACLAHKLPQAMSKLACQHMITIFRDPYKVIFNLIFCMTPSSIIHDEKYISTAS